MAIETALVVSTSDGAMEVVRRLLKKSDAVVVERNQPDRLFVACPDAGFNMTVNSGTDGFFETDGPEGVRVWQPASFATARFRFYKDQPWVRACQRMLELVARFLDSGTEDCMLVMNGDQLLFERMSGEGTAYAPRFWGDLDQASLPSFFRDSSLFSA